MVPETERSIGPPIPSSISSSLLDWFIPKSRLSRLASDPEFFGLGNIHVRSLHFELLDLFSVDIIPKYLSFRRSQSSRTEMLV
jgi:hypothetical protein